MTCPFFEHLKNSCVHLHKCHHMLNFTKRCGYEISDWYTCPIIFIANSKISCSFCGTPVLQSFGDSDRNVARKINHIINDYCDKIGAELNIHAENLADEIAERLLEDE